MSEDNNSNNDLSREELNEQLDELRQKQQEHNAKKKPRSRWKRLLGFLGVISSLFLLGTSCSKPTVMCYRRADPEDEEEATENAPNSDLELETSPDNSDNSENSNVD